MARERILAALLASPPTTSGARTRRKAEAAVALTGCTELVIANLFGPACPDVPALSAQARQEDGWLAARPTLADAIRRAEAVLVGWGLAPLTGPARRHRSAQLEWIFHEARSAGHSHAWTVGGEPRHPSRWHQYVSDKHGRTGPGSFEERLGQVLVQVPLSELCLT